LPYSDQGRFLLIKKREITPFYHSRERTNDKKKYQPHEKYTHHIIYPHILMPLMAQGQIELKELQPKAAEVIPVKVEMIDNQEVLTVSNYNHSIQIPLTAETKAEIDAFLEVQLGDWFWGCP